MTHPELSTPRHLRRTKLIGAFAFGLLVGVGSYTVTYHVLDLMSPPATVVGIGDVGGRTDPRCRTCSATAGIPTGVLSHPGEGQISSSDLASRTIRCTKDCMRAHATSGWSCTKGRNCQAASA